MTQRIEVVRQGQSVFIDRVHTCDGEVIRHDRMFAAHVNQWAEVMGFAHDIATREELRWGFWRPRFNDGAIEFIDLTDSDGWRLWALRPPMDVATEHASV
jgi:hypothetical protein